MDDNANLEEQIPRGKPRTERQFWAQLLMDEEPDISILDRVRYREQRWTLLILRLRALSWAAGIVVILTCVTAMAEEMWTFPAFGVGYAPPLCCAAWDCLEIRKRRQTRNRETFELSTLIGMEFVQGVVLGIVIGFFVKLSYGDVGSVEGIVLMSFLCTIAALRASILVGILLHHADTTEEKRVAEMLRKNGSEIYKADGAKKTSFEMEEWSSRQSSSQQQQSTPRPSSRPPSGTINPDIDINQKFIIPFDLIRDDTKVRGLAPQENSKFAAPPSSPGGRTRSASF